MIIHGSKKYIAQPFDSEDELEKVVLEHFEYIFGPDAIMLPKKLIKSAEGAGTIPDGFAIDIASKKWFIVEAELSSHGVWSHIAPQVAKQIIAAQQVSTRQLLTNLVVEEVKSESDLLDKFEDHGVHQLDIRQFVEEILKAPPIVGLPIDHVGEDLRQWAHTLKNEVKLWTIRKLVDFENPASVIYEIPDEFKPTLDTSTTNTSVTSGIAVYDVSVSDLIEAGLLSVGEELQMTYKPKGGEQQSYIAAIKADGSMMVLGKQFSSPSYAALHGMKASGSKRTTVNGWTSWKNREGVMLSSLREKYLSERITSDVG